MVKPSVSFHFFMFSLSESSGIQPGGRPHATRWTRPSWRRTKAEPGPCYREPPSHLCHLCHGRTLWSQDVSSIFYVFGVILSFYIIFIHVASRRQPPAPHRWAHTNMMMKRHVGHWDQKHPKVLIVGKKNAKNLIAMYSRPTQFKK